MAIVNDMSFFGDDFRRGCYRANAKEMN
jgi:hypothetical protein